MSIISTIVKSQFGERLYAKNIVFRLCLLGCDTLYERGLNAASPGGRICISSVGDSPDHEKLLGLFKGKECPAWTRTNAYYFDWHLTRRFQG
jgi:hypothetical protein